MQLATISRSFQLWRFTLGGAVFFFDIAAERLLADRQIGGGALQIEPGARLAKLGEFSLANASNREKVARWPPAGNALFAGRSRFTRNRRGHVPMATLEK